MGFISCRKCPSRESCLKLCPQAKRYVCQDYKGENTRRERSFRYEGIEAAMNRAMLLAYLRASRAKPSVLSVDLSPLTGRQRKCIEMAFFEGITLRQIGQRLGISHVSAIKHLRRAIAKLKGLPNAIVIERES